MPAGNLNGAAAKGYTFAPNLRAYSDSNQYSVALIDLVFECIYREPGNRPGLMELKRRAALGLEATFEDPVRQFSAVDNWNDYLQAPFSVNPLPPAAKNAIKKKRKGGPANPNLQIGPSRVGLYFGLGREMRCQVLNKDGTQCKRKVRGDPVLNPMCKICKKEGKSPLPR